MFAEIIKLVCVCVCARENPTESESSGTEFPVHHAMLARAQMDPMPKLSVQSIFGPKSRHALDKSKTRWDKDCFGYHNPRPKIFDEAAVYRVNAIKSSVNYWDDRFSMASPKDSLTTRTQEISLSDEDQCDERLRAPRAELLRQAKSLLSTNKSVVLCESEPDIVEEDRAEQFPEVTSIKDNHDLELENDHPPRDAGNVQPEPVCNVPPQLETRSRTRRASLRYPSPDFPSDFEDGGLLYDSYGVPMRLGEDLGDSSNQATVTSRDKPNPRIVIHTSRTVTSCEPKDGTTASTSTTTHRATRPRARTSPRATIPATCESRRLHPCRAIRSRRGGRVVRVLRRLPLARQEGCVNELSPMGNLDH